MNDLKEDSIQNTLHMQSLNNKSQTDEIKKFHKWMIQKRYSTNTINIYIHMLKIFFSYYPNKLISEISSIDLVQFNYEFVIQRKYSLSFQNQMINAIKLFYLKNHEIVFDLSKIERPIKARSLPKVIAKTDIQHMLEGMRKEIEIGLCHYPKHCLNFVVVTISNTSHNIG